jgi:iron complex outermembrane receptor protein
MVFKLSSGLVTTALCLAGAAVPVTAQAQAAEPGNSDPAAVETRGGLQDIVVTARRRSENLQQVPVAVTAITASALEAQSVTSLKQVSQTAPNIQFASSAQGGSSSAALVYIRGVGQTETLSTSDPGVGIYLDGVYLGRMTSLDLDTLDIARIEVLRGPQGTLFGKNTIGGAVNIVSEAPDTTAWSGRAQVTLGSFDRFDVTGGVNIPILYDSMALRVSGARRTDDGYGYRRSDGERLGNHDSYSSRGSLLWKASDRLTLRINGDYNRYNEKGSVFDAVDYNPNPLIPAALFLLPEIAATYYNPVPGSPPYGPDYLTPDYYSNYGTGPNYNKGVQWGGSVTASFELPFGQIKSITGYRKLHQETGVDVDMTPYQIHEQRLNLHQNQFSQELQLSGNAFNDRLNFTTGLYYFQESALDFSEYRIISPLRSLAPSLDVSYAKPLDADNKSYAAYGQGTFKFTDQLSLTAGLRYSYDRKIASTYQTNPFSGVITFPYTERRTSSQDLSPRLSVEYRWMPDIMTYASIAKGYKSGGANGRASSRPDAFNIFDPETVWTYEVGAKTEFLDRRVRLNLATFYSDYKDIQVTSTRSGAGENGGVVVSYSVVENAAAATIKGFEAELTVLPVEGLTLAGSVGYLDARYDKVDARTSLTGNENLQNVPRWNASVSGEYSVPVGPLGLTARIDYSYRSEVYYELLNSPRARQPGYGILNGRITLKSDRGDGPWALAVFGTNLTDTQYYTAMTDYYSSLGFVNGMPGRPREFGVTLSRRF